MAQNAHAREQPAWLETQTVLRPRAGMRTASTTSPARSSAYFTVPSDDSCRARRRHAGSGAAARTASHAAGVTPGMRAGSVSGTGPPRYSQRRAAAARVRLPSIADSASKGTAGKVCVARRPPP